MNAYVTQLSESKLPTFLDLVSERNRDLLSWPHQQQYVLYTNTHYQWYSLQAQSLLLQPFYGHLSGTTRVRWYQKKHSPTYLDWSSSDLYQLLPSSTMIHSIFPVQLMCLTIFFHNLSPSPLVYLLAGMQPSTSYSIRFFTQSVSSFHNTCWYHRSLFCCSTKIISSIPNLSVNSLLGTLSFTLTSHIHLTKHNH